MFIKVLFSPSDWIKVTDEKECGGSEKSIGTKKTLSECAENCRGISSMFIYGTNDFGETKCKTNGKEDCPCYCETSSKDGECKWVDNKGYSLYKYVENVEARKGKKCGANIHLYHLWVFRCLNNLHLILLNELYF